MLNPFSVSEAVPLWFWSLGLGGEKCLATTPNLIIPTGPHWLSGAFRIKTSAEAANGRAAVWPTESLPLRKLFGRRSSLLPTVTVLPATAESDVWTSSLWPSFGKKSINKSLSKAKPFCGQLKSQLWGHVCEKEEGILWQGLANQPHLPSPLFRCKGKKRRHQKMSQFWKLHSWYLFFIAVRTWMKIMKLEEHLYFPSGFKNVVLYWKTTFSMGQVQERQQELGH